MFFSLVFAALTSFAAAQPKQTDVFLGTLQTRFSKPASCKRSAACICSIADERVMLRLLSEYGSIFAAAETVQLPGRCIFENESQVAEFHSKLRSKSEIMNGVVIELQEAAMTALLEAQAEARKVGLRISPLDGSIAGKRSYSDTTRIWNSRYLKALNHWVRLGKISTEEADAARKDTVLVQIRKVIDWESGGLNFGTNLKGSIFSSAAPPGTSHHISMLAFDVIEYANANVRCLLNRYGWFQTILSDAPHFTYLGFLDTRLTIRGLTPTKAGPYEYWVPYIPVSPKSIISPSSPNLTRHPISY